MTPKLNEALVKFQSEITAPKKTKKAKIPMKNGGNYEYMYADLAAIMDHIRAKMLEHGLAVDQGAYRHADGRYSYRTTVMHVSGEERFYDYPMFQEPGNDPKPDGSWFTYYRRYGLCASLGIAAEEDDDGGAAGGQERKPKNQAPRAPAQGPAKAPPAAGPGKTPVPKPSANGAPAAPSKTSADQIKRLFAIAKKSNWTEEQLRDVLKISSNNTVASFKDLEKKQYDWLCTVVDEKSYADVMKEFGG
jgi:hypothetical protein